MKLPGEILNLLFRLKAPNSVTAVAKDVNLILKWYQNNASSKDLLQNLLHNNLGSRVIEAVRSSQGSLTPLINLREGLLKAKDLTKHQNFKAIDAELKAFLKDQLASKQLIRLTTDSQPELLKSYHDGEVVHPAATFEDSLERLKGPRRVFAFTHNRIPNQLLAFVNITLTREVSSSIQAILNKNEEIINEQDARCAIFYSINSPLAGLSGIDLGHDLIMQSVKQLQEQMPSVKTFCTLSPIPLLKSTLKDQTVTDLDVLRYLQSKRDGNKRVIDPVANFHLSNGARIYRVNRDANQNEKGQHESYGYMVNYLYDVDKLQERSDRYKQFGEVSISDQLDHDTRIKSKI